MVFNIYLISFSLSPCSLYTVLIFEKSEREREKNKKGDEKESKYKIFYFYSNT